MNALAELREHVRKLPPGRIADPSLVRTLLARCWDNLLGANVTMMSAEKVRRAEDLEWHPPNLTFVIERHGSTVLGSTRAALHHWTVDAEHGQAVCDDSASYRQLDPRDRPLQIKPLVDEIVSHIVLGAEDKRLSWSSDRRTVRVLVSQFISGRYTQTQRGRRKRFRTALERALAGKDWEKVPGKLDSYHRKS